MALVYSSVILFWLCYNLIGLVYAVFFMLGREVKRKNERIRAEEPVRIRTKQTDMEGMTAGCVRGWDCLPFIRRRSCGGRRGGTLPCA